MTDIDSVPSEQPYDLTSCDREPIHALGHVQSFGCLLAVSMDWLVTHASENVGTFFGRGHEEVIGAQVSDILTREALHDIRSRLQILAGADAVERLFRVRVVEGKPEMDIAIHVSGRTIILEFEPSGPGRPGDQVAFVRPMIDRLKSASTTGKLLDLTVRQVRALTGFDRVMLYRFDDDYSGNVVAESRRVDLESFNGLRYPASDIPKQARALYLRSLLRIIADVDGETAMILPERTPSGEPLDLSLSSLRAVSPIHLEYLRNMGVQASMSISVIRRGKLWGLIACHHMTPRVLSYETRSAAEMFGQILSFVLDQTLSDEERAASERSRSVHDRLMTRMVPGGDVAGNFDFFSDAIQEVIPWDGAVASIGGAFEATGFAPSKAAFARLQRFLNSGTASTIFASSEIGAVFDGAHELGPDVAGVLAIPVSRKPRDYIVLFRREVARTVMWGGNPEKPVEATGPNGIRLTPRKSFEAWQEIKRGSSTPWTDAERATAESLRTTLLEIILHLTDQAAAERARAQERQELLIAELNHRVRNMLNLIRGLVEQTASGRESVADFTEVLGGRIHALSRAHDQLTSEQWEPSSMHGLIQEEANGFLGDSNRIVLHGVDLMLRPLAFSTLALVFHELMTNSVKYGALGAPSGRVTLEATELPDGAISLHWVERGGPAVRPPLRHGFGTAIIERAVPYELKGEAEVTYALSGLEARIVVPQIQVAQVVRGDAVTGVATRKSETIPMEPLRIASALVLEDNMIIGMDAEGILQDLGAEEVHLCGNNAAAMDLLDRVKVDVALLDVNLGAETSRPVAERLRAMGVPFVFATGYGDGADLDDFGEDKVVVQKPFSNETIAAALRRVLG